MARDIVPIGKPWPLRSLLGLRSFRRSGRLDRDSEVYPLAIHHCPCQTKNERPNLLAYIFLLNSEKHPEIIFVYVFVCSFYFPTSAWAVHFLNLKVQGTEGTPTMHMK